MSTELLPLEKALYQRELNHIIAKLHKPLEEIRQILTKELSCSDRLDMEAKALPEISEWIRSIPELGVGYYGGHYLQVFQPQESRIPDAVSRAIVRNAVAKHLALVDELDEVRNLAEQAYHNSNQ